MARNKQYDEDSPKGVLTKDGFHTASNLIYDLLRPRGGGKDGYRKDVVTFVRCSKTGMIKEVNTGKLCNVEYLEGAV